jgi:hypothetical protein
MRDLLIVIVGLYAVLAFGTLVVYQNRVIRSQEDLIVQMVSTNPACTEPITK